MRNFSLISLSERINVWRQAFRIRTVTEHQDGSRLACAYGDGPGSREGLERRLPRSPGSWAEWGEVQVQRFRYKASTQRARTQPHILLTWFHAHIQFEDITTPIYKWGNRLRDVKQLASDLNIQALEYSVTVTWTFLSFYSLLKINNKANALHTHIKDQKKLTCILIVTAISYLKIDSKEIIADVHGNPATDILTQHGLRRWKEEDHLNFQQQDMVKWSHRFNEIMQPARTDLDHTTCQKAFTVQRSVS